MSQSVALLVGGTKVLERALQSALPDARHVVAATMEEATATLGSGDVHLLVVGPTMRRGLQAVTALRAGGSTEPRILVVYRDDQQSEVKRHQKGTTPADRYVAQSHIGKELTDAAIALWQLDGAVTPEAGTEEVLEELAGDSIEEIDAIEDEISLSDDEVEEEPPPVDEVLGEFDAGAFEKNLGAQAAAGEEAVEILEDAQFEEVLGGEDVELEAGEALDASDWMEEGELAAEPLDVSAEVVEELLDAEPVEETLVAEALDAGDLQDESHLETLQADAVQVVTAQMPMPVVAIAEPAPMTQPNFARTQHKTASYKAAAIEARPASEGMATEPEPRRSHSAVQVADDLSGIVGRLQEMSSLIARLETDNELLRAENEGLRAQPDRSEELLQAELQREDAEKLAQTQAVELTRLAAELQASQAHAAALAARLLAAGRSLRELAGTLEG